MVPAKERDALRLEEDDLDFDAMPMDELIDLAGPAARFVAAAKRRSKVPIEVSKEVQKEQRAAPAKAKKSWADMMEEDACSGAQEHRSRLSKLLGRWNFRLDNFDWMPAAEAAMKSDKSSFSTAAPSEKWSWSTAATEQDFDDLLEALPEELEEQAPVAPQIAQQERERQEQEEKLRKQKQREQQEQRLQEQKEIIQERLRLQQELEQSRLRQKELEREQLRQEQQQQEQLRQHLQQEQLRQLQMQQEQLRQQQVQQEQLRQQQVQQEQLCQQQVQQEQLRQQQVQQEQLRQQQVQQEQLRQQQFQQQLHLQQGMQMQQMQLQQVPVLIAVPCMAVQPMQSMQQIQPMQTLTQQTEEKEESQEVVLPGGPQFGQQHRFHQKNTTMGVLSPDARTFTKCSNKGRLSIVCENRVHFNGVVRYAVQFTEGELCSADGVGFILSSDLPCTKNIQKIVSVFANRTGRICVRVHEDVKRCQQRVKCLELGDWLEVISDLEQQKVTFVVWPQDKSAPTSATISFGDVLAKARGRSSVPRSSCGYLAVVMKHLGVSVNLAS